MRVSDQMFQDLAGIQIEEILYGITPDDVAKGSKYQLEQLRKNFTFERALERAQADQHRSKPWGDRTAGFLFYWLFFTVPLAILLQVSLWLVDLVLGTTFLSIKLPISNFPLVSLSIPLGFILGLMVDQDDHENFRKKAAAKAKRLQSLERLHRLYLELQNYNQIIQSIQVKDQIDQVLDQQSNETRSDLLVVLEKIHKNLIKAIKVDRILRENENVVNANRESLEITFAELQSAEFAAQASRYSEFVDEVVALGISLNKEFEEMQRF